VIHKKEYILLDLDGTVTDSGPGITRSAAYALARFGIEAEPEQLRGFIGPPLKQSFMDFYGFDDQKAALAVEKYREYYRETGIFENAVYDGMAGFLEEISRCDKKLILATSKPEVFAKQILSHFGLDHYFYFIAGSMLDGARTDKAELIGYVLNHCSIVPGKAAMVGDRKHDIIGAQKNSVASIGVTYGYGSRGELEEAGADYIVDSVGALRDMLYGESLR
jgi:phosphoglycolate phosphatase